jgi:hypothetical protein
MPETNPNMATSAPVTGMKRRDAVSVKLKRPAKKKRSSTESVDDATAELQSFANSAFGQAAELPSSDESPDIRKESENAMILREKAYKVELFLEAAARDDAQLRDALKGAGLDETTDVMHDGRHYDPSAETKEQKSAALTLIETELNRVADLDKKLKANGASLADRQQLWASVPIRLRPDDVVEDLRAFALTQRLIADESDESKEESWNKMVVDLIKTGGSVVGTLLSSAGITGTTLDFAVQVDTLGGSSDLRDQTKDGTRAEGNYGEDLGDESFDDYRKKLWAIAQGFQLIGDAVIVIDKMNKDPVPGKEKAGEDAAEDEKKDKDFKNLVAQRKAAMDTVLGDTFSKLMTLKTVLGILIGHIKLSPLGALPQANGIMTACQGFFSLADAYETQLKANFMNQELADMEAKRSAASRTDDVGQAIEAIALAAGDKLEQTLKARNATMATGVGQIARGTGTFTGGSGEVISGTILFVGGMLTEFGATIYGLKNAKDDLFKSFDDAERHLELLRNAALGDADAKKEIMSDCPFYCAMYLGLAVKEGNQEAINLLNTMNFADSDDFKDYDAYMIRKAMLWAIGKDDLAPGSESPAAAALNSVSAKITAAQEAVTHAAEWVAGARDTGERLKEVDLGLPELTANSWANYKDASDKSGVKSQKTGIKEQLATYEKSLPGVFKNGGIGVEQANACLDALEEVIAAISSYTPEWKTQPEGGYAPESAIKFCIKLRDMAEKARRDLIKDCYDTQKNPKALPPKKHEYKSELTEKGFLEQVKAAKEFGVTVTGHEKLAELLGGCVASEQLFLTGRQDGTHAGGMVDLYNKTLRSISRVEAKNADFPGLNQDFTAYLENIGRMCLIKISEWTGFEHRKHAEFKTVGSVEATVASFDANLKQAHETLLPENAGEERKIRSLISNLEKGVQDHLESETAIGEDVSKYLDASEKAWEEFSKALGKYRRLCQAHKPWRLHLEKLAAIADAKAKAYGKRKVEALANVWV